MLQMSTSPDEEKTGLIFLCYRMSNIDVGNTVAVVINVAAAGFVIKEPAETKKNKTITYILICGSNYTSRLS